MKKLRYADDMGGWGKIITLTREEAIQKQKLAARVFHQDEYKDDEEALLDFMDVNSAYWVDDEDTEI